ncbi:MAG: hypothetical protein ACK4YM_01705 [Novosphingobium sp.]
MRQLAMALLVVLPAPAAAQAEPADSAALDEAVSARLDAARRVYGVPDPRLRCRPQPGSDEIVVCPDRGEDLVVPSTSESDPDSLAARRALNGGVPRAPQFDRGSCKGKPGCITGGWAPPPVYYVDLTSLPQAPEGSDAERIAKGEEPAP